MAKEKPRNALNARSNTKCVELHFCGKALHITNDKREMIGYDACKPWRVNKIEFRERCAMKFPGGFNIQQMMKQAQVMQEKMQKEMEELRVSASAGGGVVNVEMKGNHEVTSLKIDPEALKDGDVEMLQDLIQAAINEANRKVDEAMKGKLGGMLPPGLGGMLG